MTVEINKKELIELLTSLYTDAQMAIDGIWDSTYDKNGHKDQQYLIEQFCKSNNIELAIAEKTKYVIEIVTVMFGQEISRDYYMDSTNEIVLFNDKFVATRAANKMCDEFVYTIVVKYEGQNN